MQKRKALKRLGGILIEIAGYTILAVVIWILMMAVFGFVTWRNPLNDAEAMITLRAMITLGAMTGIITSKILIKRDQI